MKPALDKLRKPRPLYLSLCGGLGNQLFQYASALGIAAKMGRELLIDGHTGFINEPFKRTYELHRFAITARTMERSEAIRIRSRYNFQSRLRWRFENVAMLYGGRSYVPVMTLPAGPRPVLLRTYLQSYKYFPETAIVNREFSVTSPPGEAIGKYAREIAAAPNSVSVHFRLTQPVVLPAEYQKRALAELKAAHSNLSLFVFSDVPVESLSWLSDYGEVKRVLFPGPSRSDLDDLYLMSQCRHNIVANSTFSWWAAWRNPHPGKEVYGPRQFFPFKKIVDPRDVFPPDWKVL